MGTIRELGGHGLHELLMNVFHMGIQSTKHPSFREERGNGA